MPWNGSGTYAPPSASFPEVTGTTIDAARFNATVNDLASGITAALAKNGENAATANLSMGGFKHTGAAAATALGEYVTWNQTGVRFPGLGIGVGSAGWAVSTAVDLSPFAAVWGGADGANFGYNTYFDGTNYRAKITAAAGMWNVTTTGTAFLSAVSVAAGAVQNFVPRFVVQTDGTTSLGGNTSVAGTLTVNGTLAATGTVSAADADLTAINCSSIGGTSAVFLDGSGVAGLNASNLASGTVPSARMSGSYGISITGSAATATSATTATTAATATAATDYKSRAISSAVRSSGTGEAASYASEVYDTGGNFNPTTGRFTAPATGVYLVTWTVQANAGAGSAVSAFARVDGSTPNLGGVVAITGTTVGGAVAVPLTSGQYVSVWMSVSGGLDCNITEFQVNRIA